MGGAINDKHGLLDELYQLEYYSKINDWDNERNNLSRLIWFLEKELYDWHKDEGVRGVYVVCVNETDLSDCLYTCYNHFREWNSLSFSEMLLVREFSEYLVKNLFEDLKKR